MRRLLIVLALSGLLLCAGFLALCFVGWAVATAGAGTEAGYLVAVGLAVLLPTALVMADHLVPGRPRPALRGGSCPHCGIPIGGVPKPDGGGMELWCAVGI